MRYALQRLREPSTLAGLSVLATLFGVDAGASAAVAQAVAAVAAAAAVFVPEQAAK